MYLSKKIKLLTLSASLLMTAVSPTLTAVVSAESSTTSEQATSQHQTNTSSETAIEPYGKKITIQGKQMNIYETGEGSQTLVFIPGLAETSQVLSHHNLIQLLAKKYKIIVVEPFGYGLSDTTDRPRTAANITDEIHEALQQLGLTRYTLVGHSLSGSYALVYAQKYASEMQGFIGIDSSTTEMNGGNDVEQEETPEDESEIHQIPDVEPKVNEQYRAITKKVANNATSLDELKRSNDTINEVKDLRFPKGLPAMYLLSQESKEEMDMRRKFITTIKNDWEQQHINLSEDPKDVTTHVLSGSHLLYLTAYKEMAEKITAFVDQLQP